MPAPPYSLPSEAELAAPVLKIEAATGLAIMLYNYPGRTGVAMGEEFLDLVAGAEDQVLGFLSGVPDHGCVRAARCFQLSVSGFSTW